MNGTTRTLLALVLMLLIASAPARTTRAQREGVAVEPSATPQPPEETPLYPFETIIDNGDPQRRVDIAVVGDGYTAAEMQQYRDDVQAFFDGAFASEPFREYRRYFNVHRIDVPSNESGADHPERGFYVDTAFDAAYNCAGIQRLICVNVGDVDAAVASTVSPAQADLKLVIVNDEEYGGAGYTGAALAVTSTNGSAVEIVLHEFGHSFALLADEYDYGTCDNSVEPSEPNATRETERSRIKWNYWIAPQTPVPTYDTVRGQPGLYQGARYCPAGLYRPTYESKMRALGQPFDQINTEQLVKRIYNRVPPLEASSPPGSTVSLTHGQSQTFSASTPQPLGHALGVTWYVNGVARGSGPNFVFDSDAFGTGSHSVRVVVRDETPWVRHDPEGLLDDEHTWGVNVSRRPNDARYVAQSVPTEVTAGESYGVSVTMTNTGSNTWTAAAGYRLGSQNPQDNTTWGTGRVELPHSVAPDASVTFNFTITAPAHAGWHDFQWRVLREGHEWFGDLTPNVRVYVNPPGPRYEGFHDGADCRSIGGWAWDRNRPHNPVSVDIYSDNALLATVRADLHRPDLCGALGDCFHAFDFPVPDALKDAQPHSIRVRHAGTNIDLGTTPKTIACGRYIDVPPDHPFYYYIECLSRRGIVGGYADGTFRPNNPVTRAQFAKMVVLAAGWPLLNPPTPRFTDVPRDHPFYTFVETAVARNIISGYADGTFRPENELTRGQMSKVITLAAIERWGWTINTSGGPHFVDVPPGSTFYEFIETAYNRGVISGYGDGHFYPGNSATRAQAAKVVSLASGCTY